ncbi:MAG: 4-hydroxybenzoate 3-monooxygenase [Alphaproteobacteria bacterium]|nr:4-hydroxybenzoate 3-monooxygenase [Alphaproteobacteria bacterium]
MGRSHRTQVGIVGCGPAGLLLSQLLHVYGIESVILERKDRAYVEGRIRAGVLEQGTVDLLREAGVADRLDREGLIHNGFEIAGNRRRHRIALDELTDGKVVTVYGQTEVTKDLIAARLAAGGEIVFEADAVTPHDFDSAKPFLTYSHQGENYRLDCDIIAGCDGFHGICRQSLPKEAVRSFERAYPFAWLGILAQAAPAADELIYAHHDRGFALCSMRSETISRHYVQCSPDEDLSNWSDARIWDELRHRIGDTDGHHINEGPLLDKSITPMRSFVAEPMRHGALYLAGDAAHIVPPTGAKGLNLAMSDIHYLTRALVSFYKKNSTDLLDRYSDQALARVWKAERFSWWMTSLLHKFPNEGGYDRAFENRMQEAEIEYLMSSHAAQTVVAENYVGLPF